ncbi:MAG: hypothetical protein K5868_08510 [Lachnospiraceae bacterium]|nr:hypothetical protein [Lachnospiraceae bacterium]
MEVKRNKFKRILAIIGAIVLILMYLLLLIFAIIDVAGWQRYFFACLGATIIIPVILWINIYMYDRMMERRKEGQ